MSSTRLVTLSSSLLIALVLASSCTPSTASPPRATGPVATASPSAAPSAAQPVIAVSPPRPPPPAITAPMQGEPPATALAEARLVTSTCENFKEAARQVAEARIKQMRIDVDRSYKTWAESQPSCWEGYRYRARPPMPTYATADSAPRGYGVGYGSGHGRMAPASAAPRDRAPDGAQKAKAASGTNNQVAGVDEADIVKNDGRFVYIGANGALRIIEALKPHVVSVTKVDGSVRELFVEGDRAVVYTASGAGGKRCTYGYDCVFAGDGTATRILVYDISNRAAPKLTRQIDLSGSLMAARRIGNAVHTVVADGDAPAPAYATWPADLQTCGTPESVVRAKFAKLKTDNERKLLANTWFPTVREKGVEKPLCGGLLRTAMNDGQSFTTVVSFDLRNDGAEATTATLQSRPGAVFASSNALYLSVVHRKNPGAGRWYSFYASVDEASEIHKFRIGASPSETRYAGSGVVPGHVLNQFAMDEWYGYLRVATTKGRVPDPRVESAVSILAEGDNGNLVRVGAVEKIAPGEDIRAVRFDDDRGYVVTFKKTDPLFVIDLYQPAHPVILGELKIPGFSTYIHRIDPDHLLSIGFDANDHGNFAYFDGVILQLFDVKNPTDPKLMHKEKIGTRGSSSEAATNHLAFNFFAEKGLLAIPMTICEGGGDGRNGTELTFSGLLVYDVNLARGFTRLGGINHGPKGASCGTWWSNANSMVKRSIFLDDLVYSIAMDRAKVQRMGHFGEDVADLALMP
ncbi:MAG: beta-propeller domain-containing protein [Deltaproteobacteria bacterium]|nr:beta-propeller domain-containing protein [Deltaproteobacteria bacterium]